MKAHWLLLCCGLAFASTAQAEHRVYIENVLGTSLDLTFYGIEYAQAESAVANMSEQIARLESELSTWRPDSAISRLNNKGSIQDTPASVLHVIDLCELWFAKSKHHFSCRMGNIQSQWRHAEASQLVPDRIELRKQARALNRIKDAVSTQGNTLYLTPSIKLDTDGVAKGWILDQAMTHFRELLPTATGIKLGIGGDILLWGRPDNSAHWLVAFQQSDSVINKGTVSVPAVAIATSGHTDRYYTIERRKFSHIISPADGWPTDNAPTATVIAPNAATADAVATALTVQPVTQGIDWVNQLEGVEALVQQGSVSLASEGWHHYVTVPAGVKDNPTLRIDYQIPNIKANTYHRPYLAMWFTDKTNKPVRHMVLLGESERWARENKQWWRRVGRKTPDALDALSRPTRRPGQYSFFWNGLSDKGEPVPDGEYWLHIEASREEGGHDYQKFSINTAAMDKPVIYPGQGEIGKVVVTRLPTTL